MVRKLWFAATLTAGLALAGPASAQRVWQDGRWVSLPQRSAPRVMATNNPSRWQMQNGRWSAGWQAPGGWNAYRRMGRGQRLPSYWLRSDFRIPDYLSFGLAAPPRGYFWVRYYDDAVLVDDRGDVWDSVGGIGWGGSGVYANGSHSWSESYSSAGVQPQRPPIQSIDPNAYYDAPGYAYDAPIPAPQVYGPPPVYAAPPPPPVQVMPASPQQGAYYGGTFYGGNAYQSSGSSYYASGNTTYAYGGGAGTTTTVVITPAPTVTTTVIEEEVVEEQVVSTSYVRAAPVRRIVRKAPVRRVVRAKPKVSCCVCACR